MAASLFEEVTSLASPEVVERLAGGLGETPQATDRALTGAAMPAVLGGLAQQFSGGAGPARLLGLIKQQDPGGRLLDNVQAGLGGATPGAPAAESGAGPAEIEHAGQGVIGTLFGQRSDQVADAVAAHAGVRKTSAMSLLSIAGAMVMGWLGHKAARGGLDATDLGAMLSHAHGEVGRIAPPGLAAAIGATGVAGAAQEPVREPAGEPGREPVREPGREPVRASAREPGREPGRESAREPERERTYAASAAGAHEAIYRDEGARRGKAGGAPGARRGLSWLIPALLVLGLAAWLISRFHPQAPTAPTPRTPAAPAAPTVTPPQANAPAGRAATAPQATGPATPNMRAPAGPNANAPNANAPVQPVQLPSGARLNLPTNSVAFGIASFLGHPNAGAAAQRFTLRNMNFPTAGSAVSPQAQSGLNDLGAILRAYPHATVQIQGFTDNVGSPQANLALSQQRANAVRMALIQRGVAPNRVSAQGFGGANPVADNATEAGRFLNRRTDLVVSR